LLLAEPKNDFPGVIPKMTTHTARLRADPEVMPLVKGSLRNAEEARGFLCGPQAASINVHVMSLIK
jgi:hypothetical protein